MSSVAIISDIHGNIFALEAALNDINKRGISRIVCLGDLVGYYCFFNEVIDLISNLKIPTILGNHDDAFINNIGMIRRSKTCSKLLKWQLDRASTNTISFLSSLPKDYSFTFSKKEIYCVHGGLKDYIDEYLFELDDFYLEKNKFEKDILLTGHTHLASMKRLYSGKIWLNPGSIGQPRDFDNRLSYAIIDNEINIHFMKIHYNFEKMIIAMKNEGFEDYISEPLKHGKKIGYNK